MELITEQLEVLRRVGESIKKSAENEVTWGDKIIGGAFVDHANHLLSEIKVTKRMYEKEQE